MPKAIPEDYKFANNPILQDANKIDHLSSFLLITTVPSEMFIGQPDPDGRSEWIAHGPTEAKIINTPGFIPQACAQTQNIKWHTARVHRQISPGYGVGSVCN